MIDFLILERITNSLEWENTLLDRAPSLRQSCSLSSLNPLCLPVIVVPSCVTTSAHVVLLVNASKPGFCAMGFKSWLELEAAAEGNILSALKSQKLSVGVGGWGVILGCQTET